MLVCVSLFRITRCHLELLPASARNAGKDARFIIHLYTQLGVRAGIQDIRFVLLGILAPSAEFKGQHLSVCDAFDTLQIALDLYLLITAVLIRDADDKRVFFARA